MASGDFFEANLYGLHDFGETPRALAVFEIIGYSGDLGFPWREVSCRMD
jgi:hypothetical protein